MPWLSDWKEDGRVRYLGITTSHGNQHREFVQVMESQPLDFAQFSYSIANRRAEDRLLPVAADEGIAVIVNRGFEGGGVFRRVSGKPLPDFAEEIDCSSWAQFFLKFVISHPAVTCVIPATDNLEHLEDNMGAMRGRLPDAKMREEMIRYYERIT
jgi:aryl-alcohol dehydrogenase-like predicted oxidoreductase